MNTEQEGTNAKLRTIEELKAVEARKSQAAASLQDKLAKLQAELPEDEQAALSQLLGYGRHFSNANSAEEVSVFFKPMQPHIGGSDELSVFFKPMQPHIGISSEVSVFFKPMQQHVGGGDELSVSFKPIQVQPKIPGEETKIEKAD